MIQGLDTFTAFFKGYEAYFTLIGGAACYLSLEEAGIDFRATKDLDIVLCTELLDGRFAERFWAFVQAGDYQNQQTSTGKRQFYRFSKPQAENFPFMLELFARQPQDLHLADGSQLTPLPLEEEVSSLSAILLDEHYYACIQNGKQMVSGVPILKAEFIIPFKMRAYCDLTARKNQGETIDSKNIKKHKNDVLRIAQLPAPNARIDLDESVKQHMREFIGLVEHDTVDMKSLGLAGVTFEEILELIRSVYQLHVGVGSP